MPRERLPLLPLRRRPARRAAWAGLVTAALIATALFGVLRLLAPNALLRPRAPEITMHRGPTVTAGQADQIRADVEEAENLLAGYAGGHLPSLDVFVHADRRALAADLAAWAGESEEDAWRIVSGGAWVHSHGAMFIDLTPPELRAHGFWGIAHEAAHAYQERLYSPAVPGWERGDCWLWHGSTMAPYGPMWLLEGSAERLAFHATAASTHWEAFAGGLTPQQVEDEITASGYSESATRLEFLANATYLSPPNYDLSFAAVTRLEELRSPAALLVYYRELGEGQCWLQAFEAAFGITVGEFYDDFEMRRPPTSAGTGA